MIYLRVAFFVFVKLQIILHNIKDAQVVHCYARAAFLDIGQSCATYTFIVRICFSPTNRRFCNSFTRSEQTINSYIFVNLFRRLFVVADYKIMFHLQSFFLLKIQY